MKRKWACSTVQPNKLAVSDSVHKGLGLGSRSFDFLVINWRWSRRRLHKGMEDD